jgi:LPXTG-motif cell wall-anchored protein
VSATPNPPGNNGTVKIDDIPFDDAPDNEPHVGCVFQVDFYGFDEGRLLADVAFESHPPTGPVQVLLTDKVFIGEDDNAGGGSQAGLDASATYTLDFTGIQPHPNQGFHVKLTVHADGSQGADTKHKVFWVTDCASGTTTTTTSRGGGSKATTTSGTTTTTDASRQDTTTTTSAGGRSASSTGGSSAGGGASSGTGGGGLPLTGANAVSLLAAGLALLGLGTAALLGRSRQRRT